MTKTFSLLLAGLLFLSGCSSPEASQPGGTSAPETSSVEISSQQASVQETSSPVPAVSEPPELPSSSEEPPAPEEKPDNDWKFDLPENHQMDPEVFASLHQALAGSNIYAMVTAKDGVIIDEYYQDGYDEASAFPVHSCSKSFTSALTGIAIDQGYVKGVDDLLSDYLPQVLEQEDVRKHQLTLYHLLTQTSGLEWYEWSRVTNWTEFRSAPNWVDYILGRNLVSTPGAVANYSTGNTHLLAAALEQAVGMNLMDYAQINLFEPLGIQSAQWGTDPQGITDGGNGLTITARDAARFGQLYLQNGEWQGKQVVPAKWVEESTSIKTNGQGDSTGSYGYQWWIRPMGAGNYDTFYALGAWGQYILVVPELELVTVITSMYPENIYAPRPFFTDYILAAYLPEENAGQSS